MGDYITNVDKNTIEGKVKKILADRLGLKTDNIKKSSLLGDHLGIDSFDSLRVIFEVENEFDIDIPQKGSLNIKDVISYI
ncbi:MAG: phosphopantetheine-binding protein [Thermodesulfovibrionia bacterium]